MKKSKNTQTSSRKKKGLGNPAALVLAAKPDLIDKAFKIVGGAIAVGALYFGGKHIYQKVRSDSAGANAGGTTSNSASTRLATEFYRAMITTYEWWNDIIGDGTNEEVLYELAKTVHDTDGVTFKLVSTQYSKLYNRSLHEDIRKELDSVEEQQNFNEALASGATINGLGSLANKL